MQPTQITRFRRARSACSGLACLPWLMLSAGCAAEVVPRTELILVADTDIAELDEVSFVIQGGDRTEAARTPLDAAHPAPRFVGVVLTRSSSAELRITTTGYSQGEVLLTRTARVSFQRGETLVVPMHLVSACIDHACTGTRPVCTERGCMPEQVDPDSLERWQGQPPRLAGERDAGGAVDTTSDAGSVTQPPRDAGQSGPVQPRADAGADAGVDAGAANVRDAGMTEPMGCDSENGRPRDLQTDPNHCGRCDFVCAAQRHSEAQCVAGKCVCEPEWADCNNDPSDGCESSPRDRKSCGVCEVKCRGNQTCLGGLCL